MGLLSTVRDSSDISDQYLYSIPIAIQTYCPMKNSNPDTELQPVKHPQRVRVLILADNRTTLREFYLISSYRNLVKVDLSYNRLTAFPPGFTMSSFPYLRTLLLHYNKFSSLKALAMVVESYSVIYLTLFGNPLEEAKARHYFVNQMSSLQLMDDKVVKLEERHPNLTLRETAAPLVSYPLTPSNADPSQQTQYFLTNVVEELRIVRSSFLQANPIIKIQRWWRKRHQKVKAKTQVITLESIPAQETISQLQAHKKDLQRLVTEKMQEKSTSQQKIMALLKKNHEMWGAFMGLAKQGIYLKRQYCQQQGIQFDEIPLRFFRLGRESYSKRLLNFIFRLHMGLITGKTLSSVAVCKGSQFYDQKTVTEKLQQKETKYHPFVSPKLLPSQQYLLIKGLYRALLLDQCGSFPLLFPVLAKRPIAAVTIQRVWRGSKVRQHFNVRQFIKQRKAATRIQKWIRGLKFQHRHKFLLEVNYYLSKQNNNHLMIQYGQTSAVLQYIKLREQSGNLFVIPFQKAHFTVKKTGKDYQLVTGQERNPTPQYMKLPIMNDISSSVGLQRDSKLLEFLFEGVVNVQKVENASGTKYIKYTYQSVTETKARKFALALKTYRMAKHQFIRSADLLVGRSQSFLSEFNSHHIVSMKYEKHREAQEQIKLLEQKRSQTSLHTDINMEGETMCMRIKFFLGTVDLSCVLYSNPLNYCNLSANDTFTQDQRSIKGQLSNRYYLGRKHSQRVEEDTRPPHRITRHIISLDELREGHSIKQEQHKESYRYPKILNTDQSHSVIDSLQPDRSLSKLGTLGPIQGWQNTATQRQIYQGSHTELVKKSRYREDTEIQTQRKERASLARASHTGKLQEIAVKKEESLVRLRQSAHQEKEMIGIKVEEAKKKLADLRAHKRDQIRQRFKNKDSQFEKDFMKKGVTSMRKEMRSFEKSKSFHQPIPQPSPKQRQKRDLSLHRNPTEALKASFGDIRKFEMQIKDQSIIESIELRQQRAKERLKQQMDRYKSRQSSLKSETSDLGEKQEEGRYARRKESEVGARRKERLSKKKRMVHSVFPQEFYPLAQGGQIGFELPPVGRYG